MLPPGRLRLATRPTRPDRRQTRRRSGSSWSQPWRPVRRRAADATITVDLRPTRSAASAGSRRSCRRPSGTRSRRSGPRRSRVSQRLAKCARRCWQSRSATCDSRKPITRHRRLLRARRERPRRRRAAEQRDELAPLHSITSSARGEQRRRHGEAERLGGLEVDDQLELGRLLDRQVGGLRALENPADVDCRPADRHRCMSVP